jgi:hypothetical protein
VRRRAGCLLEVILPGEGVLVHGNELLQEVDQAYPVTELRGVSKHTGVVPTVFGERVNLPPQPAHYRLLCRIDCEWPAGFVPFQDPRLEHYVHREAA